MDKIKVTYNDDTKEFEKGTSYKDICSSFNVLNNTIAVKVDNDVKELIETPEIDVEIVTLDAISMEGRVIYKSGLKFIFEVAVKELYPQACVTYEHSVPLGMLTTIVSDKMFNQSDIDKIGTKMKEIIEKDIPIKKISVHKKEALKFFNQKKQFEKADNIANISDKIITIYELNGHHNYFYSDMPHSTNIINKYEIVNLGNNKIIFILPSSKLKGQIPNYIHHAGIIDAFIESKEWILKQKMQYVTNLNVNVGNGRIKSFMKSNEIVFNLSLFRAATHIMENKNIKFIMVAGPSSSGKTTSTSKLATLLNSLGYDTIKISTDDYFVDRDDTPLDENGEFNFEALQAIDLDYLNNDLKKLLNKEPIKMPVYNFITGKKEMGNQTTILKENSIILIEGLHALNDELTPQIDSKLKYKIYLSPFMPLSIDRHNYISSIDLRLLRRIVRDNRTRGYGVATTIHNWKVVRSGEEKYIFPYIHQADIIINTSLIYEIGVLKVYIEPLLLSIGVNSPYYSEAKRLLRFLKQFFAIPSEYVPKDSIVREFIGGNDD